jgi:hypothetical protein
VFQYIQHRLQCAKGFIIGQVVARAKKRFFKSNLGDTGEGGKVKPNDFKNINQFLSSKFDLEHIYSVMNNNWKEQEIYNLLKFLQQMCENCFLPAQMFLRN